MDNGVIEDWLTAISRGEDVTLHSSAVNAPSPLILALIYILFAWPVLVTATTVLIKRSNLGSKVKFFFVNVIAGYVGLVVINIVLEAVVVAFATRIDSLERNPYKPKCLYTIGYETTRMGVEGMNIRKTNIHTADYEENGPSERDQGATGRQLTLNGENLGVRIEEMDTGGTSSYHHYHTAEEEHVVVLSGVATLHLGDERVDLVVGDHIWFPAGEEVPHHIENTSSDPFKFLVFGERKQDDVVFYPDSSVVLVKSVKGFQMYNYDDREAKR